MHISEIGRMQIIRKWDKKSINVQYNKKLRKVEGNKLKHTYKYKKTIEYNRIPNCAHFQLYSRTRSVFLSLYISRKI